MKLPWKPWKPTNYGAKTSRHWQGNPTDLLWCKNVTSLTGGSNRPFRSLEGRGSPNPNRAQYAWFCIFVFLCCIYAFLFCIFASSQERQGGGQIWAANGSVGAVGLAASGGARWNLYSELFTKIRKAGSEHKRSWNFPISTVYGSIWIHYLVKYSVKLLP